MRYTLPTTGMIIALAAVLVGCATNSGAGGPSDPPSTETSQPSPSPAKTDDTTVDTQAEAGWIDAGSAVALLTFGSSSCPPTVGDVSADGQKISVEMQPLPANTVCTMDMAPRATWVPIPESVDRTTDAEMTVTDGELVQTVTVPGVAGLSAGTPSQTPVAARIGAGDGVIMLLSWGSSTCKPVIESAEQSDPNATVLTFAANDGPCTKDLVPRLVWFDGAGTADGASITLNGLEGSAEPLTITLEG